MLLVQPRIVIMDEASAALDHATDDIIRDVIQVGTIVVASDVLNASLLQHRPFFSSHTILTPHSRVLLLALL